MKNRGFEEVSEQFKKFKDEPTILPKRGSKHSAGWDFFLKEDISIGPGFTIVTWSDVKAYMQPDEVLKIHIRSSVGIKQGIVIANQTGIIDSDYYSNENNDGNIGISLYNQDCITKHLEKGTKICQGIFEKYLVADGDETTEERVGGIGSSGK